MRKFLFAFSFVMGVILVSSLTVKSGKPFEGVITFKITYPDNKFSESQLAMFPKVLTVSIKGSKSRTDLQMSGMNTVEITDYTDKTKVALLNMMGQKYAIKQTTAEIEKEMGQAGTTTVELSSETKVIAGYTCKKAVITVNDDGAKSTFEVYYSNELGTKMANFDNPLYKDIDGVLLEFLLKNRDVNMKFTATSIEKKSLPAKDFEIPTDYTLTTQDELKSKFGGGNE
jgi:GLPGLI family protein